MGHNKINRYQRSDANIKPLTGAIAIPGMACDANRRCCELVFRGHVTKIKQREQVGSIYPCVPLSAERVHKVLMFVRAAAGAMRYQEATAAAAAR